MYGLSGGGLRVSLGDEAMMGSIYSYYEQSIDERSIILKYVFVHLFGIPEKLSPQVLMYINITIRLFRPQQCVLYERNLRYIIRTPNMNKHSINVFHPTPSSSTKHY